LAQRLRFAPGVTPIREAGRTRSAGPRAKFRFVNRQGIVLHSHPTPGGGVLLRDILAIEDDEEILSFRCPRTGFLAWPTVRHAFLSYLMHELAYPWPAFIGAPPPLRQRGAVLSALARCIAQNARARRRGIVRRPVMIFSTTRGIVHWQPHALNRFSDHFALATPGQACVHENVVPPGYETPRERANHDVVYTLPALAGRYLAATFDARARSGRVAGDLTGFLAARTERLFGLRLSAERCAITRGFIARGVGGYAFDRERYQRLFSEAEPGILLVIAGTVGSFAAPIQIAHAMGIPVVEYQHGACGGGQPEYNFAPVVRDSSEYRRTLPDYFLSYGRWWTERINAPMQSVAVGNPHRTESLGRLRATAETGDRFDVLMIAKLGEPARYLTLASDLDRLTGGRLRIGLRPYPSELQFAGGQQRIGRIHIDANRDFYTSLIRAEVVVSGPSTTLVEALGVARRVFIWEEAGAGFKYPDPLFERFTTAAELADKLTAPPDPSLQLPASEDVWAPDWRGRYAAFLAPFLR
jgi:hypothetical protein